MKPIKMALSPSDDELFAFMTEGGGGGSDLCSREEGFGNNHLKHWYTLATNSRLKGIKNDKEDK